MIIESALSSYKKSFSDDNVAKFISLDFKFEHVQLIFSPHLFIYDHCIDLANMEINEQKRASRFIGRPL
jgi:hypothetical protein